jgi:RNA polymerase sigma-B factor
MASVAAIDRTPTDEASLWRLTACGDAAARGRLAERYLRLAHLLARRYSRTAEPLEDLEQVACVGLMHAVDRFDPARGTTFSTFAVPTILGELRRHFRDRTWALRVPRDVRDNATTVERADARLASELGRCPSVAELARACGLTAEQVVEAREAALAYRCESLDRPLHPGQDDGATLGDRIGAGDDEILRAETAVLIEQLLGASLDDREREVLRLRFNDDLLQREIGVRVGLSQMQVSRILRDSLRRLRLNAG